MGRLMATGKRQGVRRAVALAWEASPRRLILASAWSLAVAILPAGTVWISKRLVDTIVAASQRAVPTGEWLPVAVMLGLLTAASRSSAVLQLNSEQRFAETVAQHSDRLFLEVVAHADLGHLEDPAWHDRAARAARNLRSRPVNLVRAVVQMVTGSLALIGMLGILLILHPVLLLLGLCSVAVVVPFQQRQAKDFYRLFFGITAKERERFYVRSLLADGAAAKDVRALGLAPHLLERHQRFVDRWVADFTGTSRRADAYAVVSGCLSAVLLVGAYLFLARRGIDGDIGPGALVATLGALAAMTSSVDMLSRAYVGIQENSSYLGDFFSLLESDPLVPRPAVPVPVPEIHRGSIALEDVSFAYQGAARPALEGLNLEIQPGELVALVGSNGAGKTTLIKLLLRFYDPLHGSILVGGTDLRAFDPEALRERIGVLFQDYTTFGLSVRDNVRFGRVAAPHGDGQVLAALAAAKADHLLAGLTDGLDTFVGRLFEGGQDLSGGERQRLALARIFYRQADLWILDEPTAALDPEAESAVFTEFRDALGDRIGIIISHRFSTVRAADRIVVLESGQVTEIGTHDELMARGGRYAELFTLQAAAYSSWAPTLPGGG
ncbi:MAG: ABC transporter ATP-binding protein [Egibacteraceae bacterium]